MERTLSRLTLLLSSILLHGCSPEPGQKGALVWARGSDSATLDPAEVEWGEDAKITQNLYETLVAFKHDSVELEGRLAKSWSFSADGKTLTFELREGVKFHDGTPFDAEAVAYSFRRLIDTGLPKAELPKLVLKKYDGLLDRVSYYFQVVPDRDEVGWRATVAGFKHV